MTSEAGGVSTVATQSEAAVRTIKTGVYAYVVDTKSSTEARFRREAHDELDLLVTFRVELEHGPRALTKRAEQVGEEPQQALRGRVRGRVGVAEPLQDGDTVAAEGGERGDQQGVERVGGELGGASAV